MGSNHTSEAVIAHDERFVTIVPEANPDVRFRGDNLEAMRKRRHQQPKPKKEGCFWYIRVRQDTLVNGVHCRKLKRIKLAPATRNLRDVQAIADELLRPMNQGLISVGGGVSFAEYVQTEYLNHKSVGDLASSTLAFYKGAIRKHLLPTFSSFCLHDFTPRNLKHYFANMADNGIPHPTIAKVRDAMSHIMSSATKDELIPKNPMVGLKLPKDKRPRRRKDTIAPEVFERLLQLIPEPYATAIYVAIWTGLRVSELVALRWRCVDVKRLTLSIEERYYRGDWSKPKTTASAVANFPVAAHVIARIERLKTLTVEVKAGHAIRRHKVVKSDGPDDLVFQPVWRGEAMNADNIRKRFIQPAAKRLLGELKRESEKRGEQFEQTWKTINWLVLRRSHATWLVQSGADPKSVQGQMRHTRISTTMDIYAQIVAEGQRRALEQVTTYARSAVDLSQQKLVTLLSQ
jgi:integrase